MLAWFVIDYFVHNIDLMSLARKSFHHKIQTMKPYWQMKHNMFGTLNGLIHYLLIYQLLNQVKQLPQFQSIAIMLE